MIISEAEPYQNRNGKKEKPPQKYFYEEYVKLPPQLRTIDNLYTVLLKKQAKGQVPFRLVKPRTLNKYKKEFEWDHRILQNIGTRTKINHMENTDHFINELWTDILDYHQITRHQKKKLKEWKDTELNESEKVQTLNNTQKTYDQSLKTLTGAPISIGTMYAMLEVLKATEEEDTDKLEQLDKLLHVKDDKK